MTLGSWALYTILTLLAAAFVVWLYLRREPPGRGRLVLAGLRILAFALVLLLLFDPDLRGGGRATAAARTRVLLDASASMSLPMSPTDSTPRWRAAAARAARADAPIMLFGDQPRPIQTPPDRAPGDRRSRLLPALQAAAEAGAERVLVVTDAALEDAASLPAWLARLGLGVEWHIVGEPLPGLALTEVRAPGWAAAGEIVELEATVTSARTQADSVHVVVRQDGRTIGQVAMAPPPPGRSLAVKIPVRPSGPAAGGFVRLEVALDPGDVIPADDRRLLSLFVSAEPAGVVLVSLQPDQEPRFLLPVLSVALGVPARGFLSTGTGWVRVGEGPDAGRRITEGEVARAAAAADLLVLQGPLEDAPPWAVQALRSSARTLVLPTGGAATLPAGVAVSQPVSDDWFVAAELPASPVAALLADAAAADAPPLGALRTATSAEAAWTPLQLRRGRAGALAPALLIGETAGRRWAVALGEGYWRWAFRGGDARQLYDRLWAAVGGWLMRDQAGRGTGVRPLERVVASGEPSRWVVPGAHPDSLRLRLTGAGGLALDTVLRPALGDTLQARPLPPGSYRYQALAWTGGGAINGTGEFAVETWSPELSRPAQPLADLAPARRIGEAAATGGRRPLHTFPLPYVIIVLALAAEWILRRRWGLR